ncbi:MAG: amidohydrolase family protein [Planctomycetales bacterium]|nr:amidohydrolase family protein [Planctomycetales bacterium]
MSRVPRYALLVLLCLLGSRTVDAQIAIRAQRAYPVSHEMIEDAVVLVNDGKIQAIGTADTIEIPADYETLEVAVLTPGLIDAHSVVGLAGMLNQEQDQDQLDPTESIQPQLSAVDAYNPHDELVDWLRELGVTTLHTGHAPGALVSGQTMVVHTNGNTVEQAMLLPARAVAVTLAEAGRRSGKESPGTRGKAVAMLRERLVAAREYLDKQAGDEESRPARDLELETWGKVLNRELAILVTCDRAQDIASALRLADEFKLDLWLDSAAEAYLLIDEIKQAGVPVIVHASMARAVGERENLTFENAAKLRDAGIPIAIQSGYEAYVPKTRVVLFEGAIAAANGLGFDRALEAITLGPARILGLDDEIGSLEVGKRADLAFYDGDPFEYTTHCIGTMIDGRIVSRTVR